MSSNIRVNRVCQHCGGDFVAKKTTSRTCSDHCAKMFYKARQRAAKMEQSDNETLAIKAKPIEEVKIKEFLNIADASKLLGVSRWTLQRLIKRRALPAIRFGNRIIISRQRINDMFDLNPHC